MKRISIYLALVSFSLGINAQDLTIASSGNFFVGANADVHVNNNCTVNAGGTLEFDGSTEGVIRVDADFTNAGTITKGIGKIAFEGSADQDIDANGGDFYKVELNNSGGNMVMTGAMTVSNTLTMTSGYIQLGTNNLTIGSSGSISGATSSRFIITASSGQLRQDGIGSTGRTGAVEFPIGFAVGSYTPLTITNAGTDDRFDVYMDDDVLDDGTSGSAKLIRAVDRTWHLSEASAGGSNATVKIQWNATEEMTGFDRTECYISVYNAGWSQEGSAGAASDEGGGAYSFTTSSISSFGPFGIGAKTVLPVELIEFKAKCVNNGETELFWSTASEINNSHFELLKSENGQNFELVASIPGNGNTESISEYRHTDSSPSAQGAYYQLVQYDFDGTEDTFDPLYSICGDQQDPSLYRNQQGEMMLLLPEGKGDVILYDSRGKSHRFARNGNTTINLDAELNLSPGVYFIQLAGSNRTSNSLKFVVD